MIADKLAVLGTVAAAAFALGMDYGTRAPVICPDKAPHEQLISITISGPITVCTYAAPIGRSLRKVRA